MDKRRSRQVPSEQEIEKLVQGILELKEKTATFVTDLKPEERQNAVKFRKGGERIVGLLGELAKEKKARMPGVSVDEMQAKLLLAQRAGRLLEVTKGFQKSLADTVLRAHSDCWAIATSYYSALSRLASINPGLRSSLQPIAQFFAAGHRKAGSEPGADKSEEGKSSESVRQAA